MEATTKERRSAVWMLVVVGLFLSLMAGGAGVVIVRFALPHRGTVFTGF